MGWFLSSSGKGKKKKKGARGSSGYGSGWDPQRTLLGLKFAGVIGGVVLVAVGWVWLEGGLANYANAQHAEPVGPDDVVFTQTPDWLTPAEINQMRTEIAGMIGPGPMDDDGLRAAAGWLKDQPHKVRTLRQVRRTPAGTIEVDAEFRRPAAVLRMYNPNTGTDAEDGFHVIDDQGVRLYGPVTMTDVDYLGLPLIIGVDSSYRPRDEQDEYAFQGSEVPAALALIEALRDEPVLGMVDSISVNSRDPKKRIRLILTISVRPPGATTPIPCRVVWGLPPGHPQAVVEADVSDKVRALNALVASGPFRMGHRPTAWINTGRVQFPQAIESGN